MTPGARRTGSLILGATFVALVVGACVGPMPKRRQDALDKISGTEGWRDVAAESSLDREWRDWYQGKVAWRSARREARVQRARSVKLARMLERASVLDAAVVRQVIRSKPQRSGGLSYDEREIFSTKGTKPAARPAAQGRSRRRGRRGRRRRAREASPPGWQQVPIERIGEDTAPKIQPESRE